jgi:4-diphosphocytidyl-2C-methyl-D-erythritol kinase
MPVTSKIVYVTSSGRSFDTELAAKKWEIIERLAAVLKVSNDLSETVLRHYAAVKQAYEAIGALGT